MKEITKNLIDHYKASKAKSDNYQSKITQEILAMHGMTSAKTRHFYNNLLEFKFPDRDLKYLEIGSWQGSSLVSAMYGNTHVDAVCIDNWSQFGGPKKEFFEHCDNFLGQSRKLKVVEQDCFTVSLDEKFDIYMYDGEHSYDSQFKAITHFANNFNDSCIIVVDDWNDAPSRDGTFNAIKETSFDIKFQDDVRSRYNCDLEGYWNGMGIIILERK
jgi:hypothetical protein